MLKGLSEAANGGFGGGGEDEANLEYLSVRRPCKAGCGRWACESHRNHMIQGTGGAATGLDGYNWLVTERDVEQRAALRHDQRKA